MQLQSYSRPNLTAVHGKLFYDEQEAAVTQQLQLRVAELENQLRIMRETYGEKNQLTVIYGAKFDQEFLF